MSDRLPDPPSWWTTAGEATSGLEVLRLAAKARRLHSLAHGDGAPVVLVPGLGATDASMAPLRSFLARHGHDARHAGFGRIVPDVAGLTPRLIESIAEIRRETGREVNLVGWSLGGIISREAARSRPHLVAQVITFGSPVVGGPASTAMGRRYSTAQRAQINALVTERNRTPIEVPITAMWSRRDGVVAGEACIDHRSPRAVNIEVSSTHLGMGLDPDVWTIIATRLAATP